MFCRSPNCLGLVSLGLAFLGLSLGCDLPLFTATATDSEVFKTSDAPTIVVDTFNGSIDISNGQADEVVVEVTKQASGFDQEAAERNLENIEASIDQDENEIRVKIRRLGHTFGNCGASVVIAAPKGAKINLETHNGYIVSEGIEGGIAAKTSNGKIEVFEATGHVDAATSNGPIRIEATDAVVDARTSNGHIRFQGTVAEGEHEFRSSNGKIDVILPPGSKFRFKGSTPNGRVECEFPFGTKAGSRRRMAGIVGDDPDPKTSIELSTSNSSINIRRHD
jgi:DUF4097 and DUF4098 domain-containing protein YvlB